MAHKFTVLDTSGAVITYDDYDKIPKDTIMALISFLPDISPSGTRGAVSYTHLTLPTSNGV